MRVCVCVLLVVMIIIMMMPQLADFADSQEITDVERDDETE